MKKIILGATFVAIAALVGSPILAEAVEDLYGVKVQMDDATGNFDGIVFRTLDVVPKVGAIGGGYAIPTDNGDFIAVASHQGTADSEAQTSALDEVWHSHLVKASPNASCSNLAIDALSFEEPSGEVRLKLNSHTLLAKTIAIGTVSYIDAISNSTMTFTVGNPIDLVNGTSNGIVESISFDLNRAIDGTICLEETTP